MNRKTALARVEALSRKIASGETSVEQWKWQRSEAMTVATDARATQREIAKAAGIDQRTVGRHIAVWRAFEEVPASSRPPYADAFDEVTGFDREAAQTRTDNARTRKVLTDAPMERIEQIIDALPAERKQQIAAAAGHRYLKARQEQDEAERRETLAERREREEARETLLKPVRQATADFASLGIVGHLEQATDELRELTADASLTPQVLRRVDRADQAWREALEFAKALVGGGDES